MAEDVKGMDEQTLHELLARHDLGAAECRDINGLRAVVQEAYRIGWADRDNLPALQKHQLEELLRDDERRQAALDRLTPEERRVAELRFGLVDDGTGQRSLPVRKVVRKMGISGDRIRELERSAITKMVGESTED